VVCPVQYEDGEVLWTKPQADGENARPDLFYTGNESRPIMARCVVMEDGTPISDRAFETLSAKVSAIVAHQLISISRDPMEEPCCKTFFEARYPKEWSACINEVESWEPLLKLCGGQWKAIAMVQQRLNRESIAERRKIGVSGGVGAVRQRANRSGKRKVQGGSSGLCLVFVSLLM